MPVLSGKGGSILYNGSSIADIASWDFSGETKTEKAKALLKPADPVLPTHKSWKASVDLEIPVLTRSAGTISAGTWSGFDLIDYTFELDLETEDVTAAFDEWAILNAIGLEWKLTSNRYETSEQFGVFWAMLKAQSDSDYLVSVNTPFGTGMGVIDKSGIKADEKSIKGDISVKHGDGAYPSAGDYLSGMFGYITQAVQSVMSQGYAEPLVLDLGHGLGGPAFLSKMSGNGTTSILKAKLEFSSSGPAT